MSAALIEQIKKDARRLYATDGVRIIVDGQELVFAKWSKAVEKEINSIIGLPPRVYRNSFHELVLNYDE